MITVAGDWPDDADGDVFRRLVAHGFDFSREYSVEYNVDFAGWPPNRDAIAHLEQRFGQVSLHPSSDGFRGYAQFQIYGPVTYEQVMSVQRRVSASCHRSLLAGRCTVADRTARRGSSGTRQSGLTCMAAIHE